MRRFLRHRLLLDALLLNALLLDAGAALGAQDAPPDAAPMPDFSPAPEVQKLARFVGTWEGSGRVWQSPGSEPMRWTSRSVARKVLGGHFIQDDMTIEFASEDMPGPLVFRTLSGWDRENKRYLSLVISNEGSVAASELHWADADTVVTAETMQRFGETMFDRWITRFSDDSYTGVGTRAIGAGEPFTHVEGTFKRAADTKVAPAAAAKDAGEGLTVETARSFGPVSSAIAKLAGMTGTYRLTGEMMPAPGAPMMPISGAETVKLCCGHSVLYFHSKGDAVEGMPAYEGIGAMAYDPNKGRFAMIYANNMGECGKMENHLLGRDRLVAVHAGLQQGRPAASRHLTLLDGKGALSESSAHMISGDGAPTLVFKARFTKQ